MQICLIFLLICLVNTKPAKEKNFEEDNFQIREESNSKFYNYFKSKLANLNRAQQEMLAKKFIHKLIHHLSSCKKEEDDHRGPWSNDGDMFARML